MTKMGFREMAHEAFRRRQGGASLEELVAWTGWQRSSLEPILSRVRSGKIPPPGTLRVRDVLGRVLWTDAMDALLTDLWEEEPPLVIAKRITQAHHRKVSKHAVASRARRLALPSRRRGPRQ